MIQNSVDFINRIRNIRKANQRSIHNCASLLDISKEHYLRFESGTGPLTLPDVELLARFFDVPLTAFFDNSPLESHTLSLPEKSQRSQYIQLRHKMIRAKFNTFKEKSGMSLEELGEKTGVPQKALVDFSNGSEPISISNLLLIANSFGETLDSFFNENYSVNNQTDQDDQKPPKWRQEYPDRGKAEDIQENDPFDSLVSALKQIPKKEQAQIAKILLQHLKSLQQLSNNFS